MDIVNLAIVLLEVIDLIAATGVAIPSCQRGASLMRQPMGRGYNHRFYLARVINQIFRGHGYLNVTTGSYLTCAGICLQDDACKSFNFCQNSNHCELNSAVYLQNMTDLLFASGCMYFDEEHLEHETEGVSNSTRQWTTSQGVITTTPQLTSSEGFPGTTPSVTTSEVKCSNPEPLGLEDYTIPDERMSASSDTSSRPVYTGRLNNPDDHWYTYSPEGSWIEVDLVDRTVVTGVITQGSSSGAEHRVTQYKVAYMNPVSSAYEHVIDANGNIEVFDGNVDDPATPVTNMFHQSIVATAVRIEPVAWINGVSFRFELLGCYLQ